MLYKIGRLLQIAGLIILPAAIAGNLADQLALWHSLGLSALGICAFTVGWLLQQAGRPK